MPWFALYTKPRNEKKVTQALEALGIEVYCPVITQVRQWSDRKKKVELPLIPSYVFVRLHEKDRAKVFEVPGAVRYLYWLGKPAIITEDEIALLKQSLQQNITQVELKQYARGQKITIPVGPFKGEKAEVKELRGNKINVILESLGIQLILQLDKQEANQ